MLEAADENPDIFYTDKSGWRNPEYISLGSDLELVLPGKRTKLRCPVQAYADFFQSFRDHFSYLFGDVIVVSATDWAFLACLRVSMLE